MRKDEVKPVTVGPENSVCRLVSCRRHITCMR